MKEYFNIFIENECKGLSFSLFYSIWFLFYLLNMSMFIINGIFRESTAQYEDDIVIS